MEYQWTTGPKMDPASPFTHLGMESKKRTCHRAPTRKQFWDAFAENTLTQTSKQAHIAPSIHQTRKQSLIFAPQTRSPSISLSNNRPHPPLPSPSSVSPPSQRRANSMSMSISHLERRICRHRTTQTTRIPQMPSQGSATRYIRCMAASLPVLEEGRSPARNTTRTPSLGG